MNSNLEQSSSPKFLRLKDIIGNPKANPPIPALIPVGRTTWFKGVKSGRYPQPVKGLGKRITVWLAEDIYAFINQLKKDSEVQHEK